jgi:hypothetical protein
VVFERSILTVSLVATAAFLAAGVHGVLAPVGEEIQLHVLLTLGSSMLVVFPHLWIAIYLAGTGRAVRLEAAAGRATAAAGVEARAHLRRALAPALLAAAGALATVAAGQAVVAGSLSGGHHLAVFVAALVLQGVALAVEWRTLGRNALLLAGLDRGTAA